MPHFHVSLWEGNWHNESSKKETGEIWGTLPNYGASVPLLPKRDKSKTESEPVSPDLGSKGTSHPPKATAKAKAKNTFQPYMAVVVKKHPLIWGMRGGKLYIASLRLLDGQTSWKEQGEAFCGCAEAALGINPTSHTAHLPGMPSCDSIRLGKSTRRKSDSPGKDVQHGKIWFNAALVPVCWGCPVVAAVIRITLGRESIRVAHLLQGGHRRPVRKGFTELFEPGHLLRKSLANADGVFCGRWCSSISAWNFAVDGRTRLKPWEASAPWELTGGPTYPRASELQKCRPSTVKKPYDGHHAGEI